MNIQSCRRIVSRRCRTKWQTISARFSAAVFPLRSAPLANEAQVQPGESVMILGLGGLGTRLMKVARFAGASPIIGVDIRDNKKGVVKSLHGDLFINGAKR